MLLETKMFLYLVKIKCCIWMGVETAFVMVIVFASNEETVKFHAC